MMSLGYASNGGSSSSSSNLSPLAPPFTVGRSNSKPNSNPPSLFTEPPYAVKNWSYPHSSSSSPDFVVDSVRTSSMPAETNYAYVGSESANPQTTSWSPSNPSLKASSDWYGLNVEYINSQTTHWSPMDPGVKSSLEWSASNPNPNGDLNLNPEYNPQPTHWSPMNPDIKSGSKWSALNLNPSGSLNPEYNPQPTHWSPDIKSGSKWSAINPNLSGSLNPEYNPHPSHWSPMNPGNKSGSKWSGSNPNPSGVSATDSFSYPSEAKPYYNPYVGSEDVPLVAINEPSYDLLSTSGLDSLVDGSSQVDYTQTLSELEYVPQWEGIWNGGLSEAKRGKRMEADDSFFSLKADLVGSLVYKNHIKPGALAAESLNNGQKDSALSSETNHELNGFANYTDFIGSENQTAQKVTGKLDSNSLPVKNHGYIPVDFSNTLSSRAHPTFPEACLQGATIEPLKEPWANQKPYTIYEKRFQMSDAGKIDTTSATKTSPGVVIKPPAVGTNVSGPGKGSSKKEVSSQVARNDQDPFPNPYAIKEEVLRLNNLHGKSDFDHGSKARSGFQLPDINIPIPDVESIETVNSEDSPCWKGAGPASLFSPFALVDESTFQLPTKKLPTSSSPKVSSGESCEKTEKTMPNENVCANNGPVISPKKTTAVKPSSSNGHGSLGESNSDSDSKTSHTIISVPVSDQEDTANPATATTMNVQILVKALCELSALLLFHCSNDANALKEKDHLALDHVISNLDTCLSRKIVQVTSKQDSVWPQLGNSNEGACAGMSQGTTEAAVSSHGQVNFHCAPDEKGNCYLTGTKFDNLKGLLSLQDDGDLSKEHNMVQAIKKILDENLECEEEYQSQTLYKNLWLEAEAELCSVSYRARFERMKREIKKCKSTKAKDISENTVASKKLSSPKISPDSNLNQKLKPEVNVGPIRSTSIQDSPVSSNDVETSVMERFNILKRRGEPIAVNGEEEQETKSFDVAVGQHLQHQNVTDDSAAMQSGGAGNSVGSGWYNYPYSSSEWEHVLKDEFAWRTDGVDP